ncbi:MAG: NADH-quinone oxidoreductase subunit NuoG [Halieaceae bacterium]|nr:NADH-quinone oxidoreductase subunit NuoG [Halieaceae bacterium]
MPVIKVDGKDYEVAEGGNLLESCLGLGLDLPYFCWHPAMGSIGACRQCAVVQYQNEEDTRGRIVMACMTPVTDGAIFDLSGERASGFRQTVVESLMVDHPHDCPVCAEGGECHLQDMTVMTGHRDRHYRGTKKTYRNQYLGPLIHHEMNRCITCYRCTRFYRDYAGGTDLAALAAHDHVYFGRHREGTLESPFAGNLVEVCPTGVFTDKSLVHDYTRKWDLQSAPSVCTSCGVGCNTLPGERYGRLKRIHNRYNPAVNGYFLCDRGRFGGTHVNAESRIDFPAQRDSEGRFQALTDEACARALRDRLQGKRLAGIGSPRAGAEANLLLQRLVGAENYASGMADDEHALMQRALAHLVNSTAHNPSLREIESADAVLLLGEDLTHTAARTALALRQAVRNEAHRLAEELRLAPWQDAAIRNLAQDRRSPLHVVCAGSTDLDDIAAGHYRLVAADQARLASDIAAIIRGEARSDGAAARIAADLLAAERPLVLSGPGAGSAALLDGAAAIAEALVAAGKAAMLSFTAAECNSMGQALLCRDSHIALAALASTDAEVLIILENDLLRRLPMASVEALRARIPTWIGIDCLENDTLARCDLVLPAAAFTETEATYINQEGRAQRAFPTHPPAEARRPAWRWLLDLARAAGDRTLSGIGHFDDIGVTLAGEDPLLQGIASAAPDHSFRSRGLKIPRQPHRYSGRTAMRADVSVHEPRQTDDADSALAFSMEGSATTDRPGALLSYVWSPGWNSNQSLHKFQSEIGGALRGEGSGLRLLDSLAVAAATPAPLPEAFSRREQEWLLQARHHLFGSDELSRLGSGIEALTGRAAIYLHPEDASRLGLEAGDGAVIAGAALEVRLDPSQVPGSAGFSTGYPETLALRSGEWVNIDVASDWQRQPELIGSDRGAAS